MAAMSEDEVRRGVRKFFIAAVVSKIMFTAILLGAAGSITWVWGWVFGALYAAFDAATVIVLLPKCPELLARRVVRNPEGTKGWDKVVLPIAAGYLPLALFIVAGLDHRYGWSEGFPLWAQITGTILAALGYAIVIWSMSANVFFEATVRIQKDRGHKVVTGGPYRFVRHPGYVGASLFTLMTAVLLGSYWALIPGVLSVVAFVVRTSLEDRTLRAELEGYEAYTQKTRYRLVPGLW